MAIEQFRLKEDLVQQIREGNQLAFTQLHNEYLLPLFYYTNRLIQEPFEAKQIVSETLFKLWQLRQNFATFKNVTAFLYVTCRNSALDFLRHQNTEKSKREVSLEDSGIQENVHENTVLHDMIQAELLNQIFLQIDNLPPQRKSVLKLIYIEGLKTNEVALKLNMSEQVVRNTKHQALQQLRNIVIEKKIISLILIFSLLFDYTTPSGLIHWQSIHFMLL